MSVSLVNAFTNEKRIDTEILVDVVCKVFSKN